MWLIHPSFRESLFEKPLFQEVFRSPILQSFRLGATKPVTPHFPKASSAVQPWFTLWQDCDKTGQEEESKHQETLPPFFWELAFSTLHPTLTPRSSLSYFSETMPKIVTETGYFPSVFISPRPVTNTLKGTFFFFYLFSPSCFLSNRIIFQRII